MLCFVAKSLHPLKILIKSLPMLSLQAVTPLANVYYTSLPPLSATHRFSLAFGVER